MTRRLGLAVGFALCLLIARPAHAQTIDPFQLANEDWPDLLRAVAVAQATYTEVSYNYLQVLEVAPPPEDGATISPDLTRPAKTGGLSPVDAGLVPPDDLNLTFRVDEYDGPYGPGYLVVGRVIVSGQLYEKLEHYGADPAFAPHDWQAPPKP